VDCRHCSRFDGKVPGRGRSPMLSSASPTSSFVQFVPSSAVQFVPSSAPSYDPSSMLQCRRALQLHSLLCCLWNDLLPHRRHKVWVLVCRLPLQSDKTACQFSSKTLDHRAADLQRGCTLLTSGKRPDNNVKIREPSVS
jgi:hypothetical protein